MEINNLKALSIKNLEKTYGLNQKPSISNINFEVSKSSFHVLIGHNGSGKTTTLKSLVGGFKKVEGEMYIFGKELNNKTRCDIAYIPENAKFPLSITTTEYLTYTYYVSKQVKLSFALKKAKEAIEKYNLKDFENKNPNNLSSGQKKKVLLTQALMTDPKILIMDEPTANFDPIARYEFWAYLKKLNNQGITMLIATHIIAEIENLATEVTVIENGEIKYNGAKKKDQKVIDLYKKYVTYSLGGFDV